MAPSAGSSTYRDYSNNSPMKEKLNDMILREQQNTIDDMKMNMDRKDAVIDKLNNKIDNLGKKFERQVSIENTRRSFNRQLNEEYNRDTERSIERYI